MQSKKMKRIYLDHAATTKLDKKVKEKIVEAMEIFGNPSSMYQEGRLAKSILFQQRKNIADILNCLPEEIIFTGSGTESDNLSIFGVVRNFKKGHIITTKIEHHAVLHSMEQLEKEGFEITYLNIEKDGIIDIEEFKKALRKDTILVSIMYANNEIGTIQPIKEISEILKQQNHEIIFHTDACQAINYLDINVKNLGVDLMTFSGSKIYGPKGIGVLYKKSKIKISPIILGGGQEMNLRSGTESLIMITGIGEALKITEEKKEKEVKRLTKLRDYFMEQLESKIEKLHINGDRKKRLPNNIHISIEGIEGEALLLMLDEFGISCATGSACSSDNLDISHVLVALNIPVEYRHGSLRFTLGRETTKEDLDKTAEILQGVVERLRSFSSVKLR